MKTLNLEDTVIFTGRVNIDPYLEKIDLIVLTSISESQPLVILEAGAAGIPCVATDSGSCQELIYGRTNEIPPLGPAGAICPLSNPSSIAASVALLLKDDAYYQACSKAIKERVRTYYNMGDLKREYSDLYESLFAEVK